MAQEKKANNIPAFAGIVILAAVIVGVLVYTFILGNGNNFEGGSHDNKPLAGNLLGTMYKGGWIVPILIGIVLIVLTFAIERLITIQAAKGKGSVENFVRKVRELLAAGNIKQAITECDN